MAEQRLIDSNLDVSKYVETWTCNCSDYGVQNVMAVDDISTLPEIDPETLPIVRQLREELAKVTAERDALLKELAGECGLCANYENCKKYPAYCINGNMWEWCGLQKEEQHERG